MQVCVIIFKYNLCYIPFHCQFIHKHNLLEFMLISNTRGRHITSIKDNTHIYFNQLQRQTLVTVTVNKSHIIICSCEAIVGMVLYPWCLECPGSFAGTFQSPFQNQQTVHCHTFEALSTIPKFHTNSPCAIYLAVVRNCPHEDCPHKALLPEDPTDQQLKPKDKCTFSKFLEVHKVHTETI